MGIVKPKPKLSLSLTTRVTNNPVNQSKLEIITCSWPKAQEKKYEGASLLVLIFFMIGRESGAILRQSCSVADAKPITFRHPNKNSSKRFLEAYN